MKEIIYLDTGVLHSFLAQLNDGLPNTTSNERGEELKDSLEKSTGTNSRSSLQTKVKSGALEVPFVFKSPEGEFTLTIQPGKHSSEKAVMSQTETGKEIISKQLHDNGLTEFEAYLSDEENDVLASIEDDDIEGKYIKLVSNFKIIDFKYLRNIIQTDTLIEFMFLKQQEEMDRAKAEVASTTNKQLRTQMNARIQSVNNRLNREKSGLTEQFKFIEKSLDYLNEILPTEAFILVGNTIAPLKNEYLREKARELTFKYGGSGSNLKITMVGKVTSKVDTIEMPDFQGTDPFFEFPSILNVVLNPLGIIKEGDLIVSPVAIYFE